MKMKVNKGRNGVESLTYWCVNEKSGCSYEIETNLMISVYVGPRSVRPETVPIDAGKKVAAKA